MDTILKTVMIFLVILTGCSPEPVKNQKIVCYGDSITFGMVPDESNAKSPTPYPEELQKLLNQENKTQYTIINNGQLGWDTGIALQYLKQYVIDLKPDVALIMFGINDAKYEDTTVNGYLTNIAEIVKQVTNSNIKPVLLTPTPITNESMHPTKVREYAESLKQWAKENGIDVIDTYTPIEKIMLTDPAFLPDSVHFREDKYVLISEIVKRYFTGPSS